MSLLSAMTFLDRTRNRSSNTSRDFSTNFKLVSEVLSGLHSNYFVKSVRDTNTDVEVDMRSLASCASGCDTDRRVSIVEELTMLGKVITKKSTRQTTHTPFTGVLSI